MKEALAEDKHATPHTVFSCQILSHSVWLLQPLGQQGQQLHAPWLFHWLQGVTFITAITWNLRRRSERKYYIHMQTIEKKGREHDTRCVQYASNYLSFQRKDLCSEQSHAATDTPWDFRALTLIHTSRERGRRKVKKVKRSPWRTKDPLSATQYSQVISGAQAVKKDERPTTKERMWFLLWS